MPKLSADERLQRLLAIIPWVASRDGPRVEEVSARFGCTEAELVDDLELLFLCGLHPYTPDMLIDVDIADGRVWIRYAEYFSRPLRLTPAEGLALLASGRTVLATREDRPFVEAEAVDVHISHPEFETVHDQLLEDGMITVEGVATATVVHVVLFVGGDEVVINAVVKAFEAHRRTLMIAFVGMIEDHVKNNLDASFVKRFDHVAEFVEMLPFFW